MNKHQRLAIIIAPFLVVGGYIATDYYQKEKHKKVIQDTMQDKAGRLIPQGECYLPKMDCLLKKEDLEITLSLDSQQAGTLSLIANHPLDGVTIAFADNQPARLTRVKDKKHWQMPVPESMSKKIRLVTSINKVFYFAEIE